MTAFPNADVLGDPNVNEGTFQQAIEDLLAGTRELPGGREESELTITAGSVTPTGWLHRIDTEADAAADDLTHIALDNHPNGRLLLLRAEDPARVVTLKHKAGGSGQLDLIGGVDIVLNDVDWLLFARVGTWWRQVFGTAAARNADGVATVSGAGVLAPHKDLTLANGGNSAQLDVAAAEIVVTDAGGAQVKLTDVNLTADLTVAGAGGLDTGAEAADTWYHAWVIHGTAGTAALLSTAAALSGLTLPAGYSHAGYAGAAYNDASGNFIGLRQVNRQVATAISTDGLSLGNATSFTAFTVTVPATATAVIGNGYVTANGGGKGELRVAATSGAYGEAFGKDRDGQASGRLGWPMRVPLIEAQTLYYTIANGADATWDTTGWEY